MPNARPSQRLRKVGPNIVRAWLDTVVNPLLRGLDSERNLLAKENWTWRFEQQSLLSIGSIRSIISFEALDNLDQFLDLGPSSTQAARRLMDQHDERALRLTAACRRFHKTLKNSQELRKAYGHLGEEDRISLRPGQTLDSLFGAYPRENHLDVLAEHIVNGTSLLPSYFSTAPLWNQYREELLKIRNASSIRPCWKESKRAGQAPNGSAKELIDLLRDVRQDLSLEYDLPLVEARAV
jgi:hypothetical protein